MYEFDEQVEMERHGAEFTRVRRLEIVDLQIDRSPRLGVRRQGRCPQSIYVQKHILRAVRLRGDFCEEGDGDALYRRSRRSNTPENRGKRPSPFQSTRFDEVSADEIMLSAGLTRGGFYHQFKTMGELYAEEITSFKQCDPTEQLGGEGFGLHRANGQELVTAYLAP
jgi:hypothetical protein